MSSATAVTLYRKYRPLTFAQVAEQRHVTRTVSNQLATNTVAHAYLFAGPRGVGKTTIARLLAKALNCTGRASGSPEPCNTCELCVEMNAGRMLDVIEVDAASQTGIDNVRENIIESARFAPSRGKFKVFIIDEAHMLSTSSFNALLKTLEEPPAQVVFILATTELHKIPATIVSRCQRFDFHRIPPAEMIPRLAMLAEAEKVTVDREVLEQIARLSEGCLRDAESLLGQLLALGEPVITCDVASLMLPQTNLGTVGDLAEATTERQASRVIDTLRTFVEQGGSVKHLTEELLEYARVMLHVALGETKNDAYDDPTFQRLTSSAERLTVSEHCQLLDLLLVARARIAPSSLPHLPLEIALVEFCELVSNHRVRPPLSGGSSAVVPPLVKPSEKPFVAKYDFAVIPTETTPEVKVEGSALVSLEEMQGKWGRCCAYVAERNVALPLILEGGKPIAILGDTVHIAFAYGFHADAIREPKNRRLLEEALHDVLQIDLKVEPLYREEQKVEDGVANLVHALGGSLS